MRRYGLHDDEWDRIKDLLPGREGDVGVTAKDNRLFVEAVLYRYRTGMPWRDLPERFGDWKAVHTRFTRWAKAGVWARVFKHLATDADNEYAMIDSTIVRAHQHSAGAQKNQVERNAKTSNLIRWSIQEIRRIAQRLARKRIQPADVIAWSLWRRAHQAAAQKSHLKQKLQL